eukprot:1721225-Rhodomonas_salina.1
MSSANSGYSFGPPTSPDIWSATPGSTAGKTAGKSIYVAGDSSLSMLNAALVENYNVMLEDPSWEHRVQITFSFKTVALQLTAAVDHLTLPSLQPDTFVLATGPWDIYMACYHQQNPTFSVKAVEFNTAMHKKLAGVGRVHVVDREYNTVNDLSKLCEQGFHAFGSLAKQHLASLLQEI